MSGRSLQRVITRVLRRTLAPGCCLACGHVLQGGDTLCGSCQRRLEGIPDACDYCAEPNPLPDSICPKCLRNPPRWQRMRIPFHYRGLVRDYLIRVKFDEAPHFAHTLTRYGSHAFQDLAPRPEVLLPVPLHPNRLLMRGYNQAEEIARLWSQATGIAVDTNALRRTRTTLNQSGLSAARRSENVRGAFEYAAKREYRHVAVVDDIVTTGSTVDEITRLLHRHDVDFVEIWALARAYRNNP
jgi:ComF family protein